RGLALVSRGDLHKRHLYRLADNTTIGSRVEILEAHRSAELRETDQRHKRRLAAPLRETAHTVVIQPVSVIVKAVPVQKKPNLRQRELPTLSRSRPIGVTNVLRRPPHHFPTERVFRKFLGQSHQTVMGAIHSAPSRG